MNQVVIVCGSCRRTWKLQVEDSPFLHLDLESHPCPFCEAYTLSYQVTRKQAGQEIENPPKAVHIFSKTKPAPK